MKSKNIIPFIICLLLSMVSFYMFADTIPGHAAAGDTAHHAMTPNPATDSHTDMWAFPNYHPLVVHFPIVLLIFAAFLQFLAHWKKELNLAVLILLIFGTLGAWLAAEVFDAHPLSKALSPEAKHIFKLHHQFSDYTTWLSTLALLLKVFTFFVAKRKTMLEFAVLVVLAGAAFTVSAAGHYGSYLVHIEGVGPKGNLLRKE